MTRSRGLLDPLAFLNSIVGCLTVTDENVFTTRSSDKLVQLRLPRYFLFQRVQFTISPSWQAGAILLTIQQQIVP